MVDIQKIEKLIDRQRTAPRIWDFSYFSLRNNYRIFMQFKKLIENESKLKILDVGCGFKPWASQFDLNKISYTGVDWDNKLSSADVVAPADRLPFQNDTFDALIYTEVLEHVDNLSGTFSEMQRVAKPNAIVYITTPFNFPEHGIPHDYQRLTRYYYEKKFGSNLISFSESNGGFSTAITSFNYFIESTPFRIFWGLKHIFFTITNIIGMIGDGFIDFVFSRIWKKYRKYFYLMPIGYAMIVRIRK
jgi:SAM-dependent methyltransferase